MTDEYLTPCQFGEVEFIEKRSRFIGRVWQVDTEESAKRLLDETRAKHRDASHNVYAWIIRENNLMRYSDDGEPQGTAGLPVLEVFRREEITNVLCVVTRYFGGVLLGAPGLVRAYAHTAKLARDASGTLHWRRWAQALVVCGYSLYEKIKYTAQHCGAVIDDETFAQDVTLTVSIPAGDWDMLRATLTDASNSAAELILVGETFAAR